jgi:glucose/arabinose dehydrogenase
VSASRIAVAVALLVAMLAGCGNPGPGGHGGGSSAAAKVQLTPLVDGLDAPVFVTAYHNRLYAVLQPGLVVSLSCAETCTIDDPPLLDIRDEVEYGGEQGLLGLAFAPTSSAFYVYYTHKGDGANTLSRFVDGHEEVLWSIADRYPNHNGGMLAFGTDGYLYVGMGDGGSAGDPEGNGQDPNAWFGKIHRIDVSGAAGYLVPADNPFVGSAGRDEVWAYGLRNPWRFSFDRGADDGTGRGDLWIGDVGQDHDEEIDHQLASSKGGENYGWDRFEGNHAFEGSSDRTGLVFPVLEYMHGDGCAVTGGYVYRGYDIPALRGTYVFADYCSGTIWGYAGGGRSVLLSTGLNISSFGEDAHAELLVVAHDGGVYRLVPDGA